MDYKQKCEQLTKFIKDLYPFMSDYCKEKTEGMIPELKELEDEKIRKEIIQFLQLPHPQFVGKRNHERWIAWLEKQGGQKPTNKIEQKPAWSEEDERRMQQIISDLEQCTVPGFPIYIGGIELEINWFKSLKEKIKEK